MVSLASLAPLRKRHGHYGKPPRDTILANCNRPAPTPFTCLKAQENLIRYLAALFGPLSKEVESVSPEGVAVLRNTPLCPLLADDACVMEPNTMVFPPEDFRARPMGAGSLYAVLAGGIRSVPYDSTLFSQSPLNISCVGGQSLYLFL